MSRGARRLHSLAATLATLPSMSLIPSAPFPICGNRRQCARCNREKILLRQGYGGTSVVVQAPTGSGKSYIFELLYPNLKTQAVFTVPTRALANDKLSEWRARGWDVGISTGDVALNLDAKVVVATLETQRGRFLRGEGPGLLVMDEFQMLGDTS